MTFPNSPADGTFIKDDFVSNSGVADTTVGELGWEMVTIGNASTPSYVASRHGIMRVTTAGTADGDGEAFVLHPDAVVLSGTDQRFRFRARVPDISGNVLLGNNFRIGFSASVSATEPTVGVWVDSNSGVIELDGASTNGDLNDVASGIPSDGVAAQGILTIAEPVTTTDQFTVGAQQYTLLTTPVAPFDIAIGADEAATKVNIVAAINASGTAGTEYFAGTTPNGLVSAATFVADVCTLTARTTGTHGNSIATTESGNGLTHGSNIFNATTLGTTTTGVNDGTAVAAQGTLTIAEPVTDTDQFTVGSIEYTLKTTPAAAYDIAIGANEAASKVNIVAAINASGTPGTEYFAGTLINPDVEATTFASDDCVLTARANGHAGNSLVSAETGNELTNAANVFDAATLGTTTFGANVGSTIVKGTWYTFDVQCSGTNANGGPSTVKLFVDGKLAAQLDNFLLGSAETMEYSIVHWQDTGGTATLELDIDYIEYWIPRN